MYRCCFHGLNAAPAAGGLLVLGWPVGAEAAERGGDWQELGAAADGRRSPACSSKLS